jgi:hypothetical protein
MHRAPAVTFLVTRSRWHARIAAFLWILGSVTVVAITRVQPLSGTITAISFLGLLVCGLWTLHGWTVSPTGKLSWDSQGWHWAGFAPDASCRVNLHLDMQWLLLLRLQDETGHTVWLWFEERARGAHWVALRRALVAYARAVDQRDAMDNAERMTVDP